MVGDQVPECSPVTLDTENIRQGQRRAALVGRGHFGSGYITALGFFAVEEIAFKVNDFRGLQSVCACGHILFRDQCCGTEEGRHGAPGVRCHIDQAARRGRTVGQWRRVEMNADGADVMGEDFAQLVIRDLADIGSLSAQRSDTGNRVGGRASRRFLARLHLGVERAGPILIDQGHRVLGDPFGGEKCIGCGRENVDNGIANGKHVKTGIGHRGHPFRLVSGAGLNAAPLQNKACRHAGVRLASLP